MTCVLECDKCYHLQETAPDAAYCAHMHVNPCYRGITQGTEGHNP